MTPGRLLLARHGQTTGNVAGILRGADSRNDPLTDEGHAQAHALARRVLALNPDAPRVYASSYCRAQQTAAPLAEALGVPVTVLDGLQEIDPGAWRGRPYADLRTHAQELLRPGGSVAFPGGESLEAVADRFTAALAPVLAGSGTPVVVSHGGALIAVLIRLLRAPPVETWRAGTFTHANAALTELTRTADGWSAARLNEH
ncbi:histidine phosphatase family protein [Deinococcus aerophilus]|uniref:Phosphoglycerate mutase n=1 Tax=Deinococcus aerophilus TaxID=522488 RepID=A0ABQ2GQQ7_9DEIO|nr:histidine phosphatase family protein [Deinococcus aerophilus]GGM07220.1 phosphoglycerate mutase [Deinococcus aerophilus]